MDVLRSYFKDLISSSIRADKIQLQAATIDYVVELLLEFTNSELFQAHGRGMPTLAWYHMNAVNLQGQPRSNAYRQLGDLALFLSGFFSKYVDVSGGLGYYIDTGCCAYEEASRMHVKRPALYELSKKFSSVVGILNSTAEKTALGQEQTIEQLFELHVRNPSPMSWHKLVVRKMTPMVQIVSE